MLVPGAPVPLDHLQAVEAYVFLSAKKSSWNLRLGSLGQHDEVGGTRTEVESRAIHALLRAGKTRRHGRARCDSLYNSDCVFYLYVAVRQKTPQQYY